MEKNEIANRAELTSKYRTNNKICMQIETMCQECFDNIEGLDDFKSIAPLFKKILDETYFIRQGNYVTYMTAIGVIKPNETNE